MTKLKKLTTAAARATKAARYAKLTAAIATSSADYAADAVAKLVDAATDQITNEVIGNADAYLRLTSASETKQRRSKK